MVCVEATTNADLVWLPADTAKQSVTYRHSSRFSLSVSVCIGRHVWSRERLLVPVSMPRRLTAKSVQFTIHAIVFVDL
jgi:hypothetical protein